MSEKQIPVTEEPVVVTGEAPTASEKAEFFFQKNRKPIIGGLVAAVVLVGGYFGYKALVVAPKEKAAAETIYKAEAYFRQDSLNKALKGDGSAKGLLYVIDNYGSTKEGNLAKYYAGVAYLRLKDFSKAEKYLKDFSGNGADQATAMAKFALANAQAELGKKDEALSTYKAAAAAFEKDQSLSSEFLFRAALYAETLNKNDEALKLYKELKAKFPKTDKGFQVDKYINRLEVQPNEFSVKE
jgi:TolA-binding protein